MGIVFSNVFFFVFSFVIVFKWVKMGDEFELYWMYIKVWVSDEEGEGMISIWNLFISNLYLCKCINFSRLSWI